MVRLCAFSDEAAESLDGQIAALMRNEIFLTELRTVDGTGIGKISAATAKEARKRLDGGGIGVWSIGSPYGKSSLGEGFDEGALFRQLRHLCELAVILGCDKLRIFSFYDAFEKKNQVLDLLSRSVEIAGEYGVGLYHENEKDIYGCVPDRVKELTAVKGLRFVYDPANYIECGISSAESMEKVFGLASYYHVKDVIAATGEMVPAGEGDGDIPELLRRIGPDAVLTVEPHLSLFTGLSELSGPSGANKYGLKTKYQFDSNDTSFDAAVSALKGLLAGAGYRRADRGYVK